MVHPCCAPPSLPHDWRPHLPQRAREYLQPRPLQNLYELCLLRLVKRLRIRLHRCPYSNSTLDDYTLRYLSTFTDFRELGFKVSPSRRSEGIFGSPIEVLRYPGPEGNLQRDVVRVPPGRGMAASANSGILLKIRT